MLVTLLPIRQSIRIVLRRMKITQNDAERRRMPPTWRPEFGQRRLPATMRPLKELASSLSRLLEATALSQDGKVLNSDWGSF